ncbi:glucosamine-6-phosphate deaminase [Listeria booriae]|uniref:Glucosamine-6-phosphate deaminase n=1 Tax=Listeria booriae TaxID=1552123 RepID=A0A7X1DQJ8_9LIST|nr:glucosamine-6-phosphate deaminase [Listeria booriae]MBC2371472.1 glucosamine-6-phosphate deaminase [Listeria booriae]
MDIRIKRNAQDVATYVSEKIIATVRKKPKSLICIAGGDTPLLTMQELVRANRAGVVDFGEASFVGLDEWVGLGRDVKGSCQQTLYDNFFDKLVGVREEQICFFDGKTADLAAECARVDRFVAERGGIDFILLGVGMNGHIGFNEPFVPVDTDCHVVELDDVTKTVMSKYFDEDFPLTQGISLGMQQIMTAKQIVLVTTGAKKAEIVAKVVMGEVTDAVPATLLRNATGSVSFVMDQDANGILKMGVKVEDEKHNSAWTEK